MIAILITFAGALAGAVIGAVVGAILVTGAGIATAPRVAAQEAGPAIGGLRGGAYGQVIEETTSRLETEQLRGNRGASLEALVLRSAALQASGFLTGAIDDLRSARALAEELEDDRQRAILSSRLGEAYLTANRIKPAADALTQGLELARSAGHRDVEAATLNNLGNLYATSTDVDAVSYYQEAARLAETIGDQALAARAQLNAARLMLTRGRPGEAERLAAAAFADLDRLPLGVPKARQYNWAGNLLHDVSLGLGLGRRPTVEALAEQAFTRAAALARELGDRRILGNALGYLGQIAEDAGRFEDAVVLTRQALFQSVAANAPDRAYLWHARLARLHLRNGDTERAIAAYRDSVDTLETIRRDFPVIDPRTGQSVLRARLGPIYQGLADLYLRRASATADPERAERSRRDARRVIERFKSAELEEFFQDDCAATIAGASRPIDQLAEDAVVLYPIVLPDRLELLVSHGGRIEQVTLDRPSAPLTGAARRLRAGLASYQIAAVPAESRVLHDWLIAPIEPILARAGATTLVFVPDGALRAVPIGVAHDGRQFLVERLALATAPGVNLVSTDDRGRDRPALAGEEVLVAGLAEGVQGFPALPGVAGEVESLRDLIGGTVLFDRNFTTQSLQRQVRRGRYRVVHLASHGVFAGDGRNSFILTHDGRLDMDQLEALLKFGRPAGDPIDLLTLSACETAAGDDRAALGLAGVAVKSGARSVLASLWQISDEATAAVIAEFYRYLGEPGTTKALALRRAQLALIRGPSYGHPSYWSPFLLIGDWR